MDAMINNQLQVSFPGWLPTGQKSYLTIPIGAFTPEEAFDYLLNYSQRLIAKGWLLTEPGLEAGEQSYNITHIVRGTQPAKDSKPATPIIYFYHDNLKWSDTKTWLNTPDDIAEFERWSGVKLDTLKSFPAGRLERGKDAQVDSDYVTVLTPARRIIWRLNPDYVDGSKTESKREFARFDIQVTPPVPASGQVSASETREPQQQDVSITEPAETPKNAVNAENGAKTGNPKKKSITDQINIQWKPGQVREFHVLSVVTKPQRKDPKLVYLECATAQNVIVKAWTRAPFRAVDFPVTDAWKEVGFHLSFNPSLLMKARFCADTADTSKPGYWVLMDAQDEEPEPLQQAVGQ